MILCWASIWDCGWKLLESPQLRDTDKRNTSPSVFILQMWRLCVDWKSLGMIALIYGGKSFGSVWGHQFSNQLSILIAMGFLALENTPQLALEGLTPKILRDCERPWGACALEIHDNTPFHPLPALKLWKWKKSMRKCSWWKQIKGKP